SVKASPTTKSQYTIPLYKYHHGSEYKRATESLNDYSAQGLNDIAYYGPVSVGSQVFQLMFDSGSPLLWVPAANCTSSGCTGHLRFNQSSPLLGPISIQYMTGSMDGYLSEIDVTLAGLTAKNQKFGLAYNVSSTFSSYTFDGIFGLSPRDDPDAGTLNPVKTLAAQHVIDPYVAIHLQRSASKGDQGTLTLGGIDNSKFTGYVNYNNVTNDTAWWTISIDNIMVAGKSTVQKRFAIVDTGTTLIVAPPDDAQEIHSLIPGSSFDPTTGLYSIPCNTVFNMSFVFGGILYHIKDSDVILPDTEGCVSGVMSGISYGAYDWVVGDVFLKNVYTVFNYGNLSVGLAPSVN
ncbi:7792_t:CDS:1, partial [Acaulospora colombiana]